MNLSNIGTSSSYEHYLLYLACYYCQLFLVRVYDQTMVIKRNVNCRVDIFRYGFIVIIVSKQLGDGGRRWRTGMREIKRKRFKNGFARVNGENRKQRDPVYDFQIYQNT